MNINVGLLGHVDSGKTSLAKALSAVVSTSALDKLPASQERGITIDLGFSAFFTPVPERFPKAAAQLQWTLVDCPGHASLIRTIIGGAHIVDAMLLVVDVTKGIQTQTAECLVVGEILAETLLVVLNKTDLLKQEGDLAKMQRRLRKVFARTKFGADVPMVAVSATAGSVQPVIDALCKHVPVPKRFLPQGENKAPEREQEEAFVFSVDHCFRIGGHGTVLTGTVLSGRVKVNDQVTLPALDITRKVKSMQMFRRPVKAAARGDRVGICVTDLEPKLVERALVCAPGAVKRFTAIAARVEKIRFFKSAVLTKAPFHVTIGHATTTARAYFYRSPVRPSEVQCFPGQEGEGEGSRDLVALDELTDETKEAFALLVLDKPVWCPPHALLIGSRLDESVAAKACRLAFTGSVLREVELADRARPTVADSLCPGGAPNFIRACVFKERRGVVERLDSDRVAICRGLFQKQSNIGLFAGLRVQLEGGPVGTIAGSFGSGGKFKVQFAESVRKPDEEANGGGKKKKDGRAIILRFKKYVFHAGPADGGDKKKVLPSGLLAAARFHQ